MLTSSEKNVRINREELNSKRRGREGVDFLSAHREKRTVEAFPQRNFEVVSELRTEQGKGETARCFQ